MTEPTDIRCTAGVLAQLVDLAAAARNPGAEPLENELQRFSRLVQDSPTTAWVMPLDAVAALLDDLAEETRTDAFAARPRIFRSRLAHAAGNEPVDAFLRSLAEILRAPWFAACPDIRELPLAPWEARARFSLLDSFASLTAAGESPQEVVAMDHPDCHGRIAALAGELQRVLYMFPGAGALDAAFARVMPAVTHARLRLLLDAVHAHFAEHH
ncbi:hypothetical protein ACIGO8_07420 [Streptomyces sp. NPDC053493]|uniref:hypothetical protein n=1 Tax=Streptomyces sp. NPDC053493 TaxID=3365705 RepID=UPI0037D320AC